MLHYEVLQLDRGDPLAARLDDVLRPVGQCDESAVVDAADISGAQPAVVKLRFVGVLVIGSGDPRSTNFQLPHRLPIIGQHGVVVVDDAGLDPAQGPPGGVAQRPVHLLIDVGGRAGDSGQRRGLGHPPGLADLDAEEILELFHHRSRNRGTPAGHHSQRRNVAAGMGEEVVQHVVPDGGYRGGGGRLVTFDHVDQPVGLQEPVRQQQTGPGHQRSVRVTPGIGMEHRDDGQDSVVLREGEPAPGADRHGLQVRRSVAVDDTLRVAGGAAGVTHCGSRSFIQFGPVVHGRPVGEQVVVSNNCLPGCGERVQVALPDRDDGVHGRHLG